MFWQWLHPHQSDFLLLVSSNSSSVLCRSCIPSLYPGASYTPCVPDTLCVLFMKILPTILLRKCHQRLRWDSASAFPWGTPTRVWFFTSFPCLVYSHMWLLTPPQSVFLGMIWRSWTEVVPLCGGMFVPYAMVVTVFFFSSITLKRQSAAGVSSFAPICSGNSCSILSSYLIIDTFTIPCFMKSSSIHK